MDLSTIDINKPGRVLVDIDSLHSSLDKASYIFLSFAVISFIGSVTTLALILYMWRRGTLRLNLYVKCVFTMALYQTLYDLAIVLLYSCTINQGSIEICQFSRFGFIIFSLLFRSSGLGVTVWSFAIIVCAMVAVIYYRQPSYRESICAFVVLNLFIIVVTAVLTYKGAVNTDRRFHNEKYNDMIEVYYLIRLILVMCNLCCIGLMYRKLRSITEPNYMNHCPLYHLLRKLVMYPLAQALSFIPLTFYMIVFGSDFPSEDSPILQVVLFYLLNILLITYGPLCLLIFLMTQRGAKTELLNILRWNSVAPILKQTEGNLIQGQHARYVAEQSVVKQEEHVMQLSMLDEEELSGAHNDWCKDLPDHSDDELVLEENAGKASTTQVELSGPSINSKNTSSSSSPLHVKDINEFNDI